MFVADPEQLDSECRYRPSFKRPLSAKNACTLLFEAFKFHLKPWTPLELMVTSHIAQARMAVASTPFVWDPCALAELLHAQRLRADSGDLRPGSRSLMEQVRRNQSTNIQTGFVVRYPWHAQRLRADSDDLRPGSRSLMEQVRRTTGQTQGQSPTVCCNTLCMHSSCAQTLTTCALAPAASRIAASWIR